MVIICPVTPSLMSILPLAFMLAYYEPDTSYQLVAANWVSPLIRWQYRTIPEKLLLASMYTSTISHDAIPNECVAPSSMSITSFSPLQHLQHPLASHFLIVQEPVVCRQMSMRLKRQRLWLVHIPILDGLTSSQLSSCATQ